MSDPVSPDAARPDPDVPPASLTPAPSLESVGWTDRVAALVRVVGPDRLRAGQGRARRSRPMRGRPCRWRIDRHRRTASCRRRLGPAQRRPSSDPPFAVAEVLPRWSALTQAQRPRRHHRAGAGGQRRHRRRDHGTRSTGQPFPSRSGVGRGMGERGTTGGHPEQGRPSRGPAGRGDRGVRPSRRASMSSSRARFEGLASTRSPPPSRPGETVVLLGASGVGKSTLANALLGRDELDTGAVREGDHKGRHTTIVPPSARPARRRRPHRHARVCGASVCTRRTPAWRSRSPTSMS